MHFKASTIACILAALATPHVALGSGCKGTDTQVYSSTTFYHATGATGEPYSTTTFADLAYRAWPTKSNPCSIIDETRLVKARVYPTATTTGEDGSPDVALNTKIVDRTTTASKPHKNSGHQLHPNMWAAAAVAGGAGALFP